MAVEHQSSVGIWNELENNFVVVILSLCQLIAFKFCQELADVIYGFSIKFADVFLDALAIEGSTRMATIAAMQCQGVPQYEIESKADKYVKRIQNRLDVEFQEGNRESIMYQLENRECFNRNLGMSSNLSRIMLAV